MTTAEWAVIAGALLLGYKFTAALLRDPVETPPAEPVAPQPLQAPWHVGLGVAQDASRADIVAAYRKLISQYHPDRVADMGPDLRAFAEQRASEINVAYAEAMQQRPQA